MAPLRDVTAKQLGLRTDARASGAPGDIILNGDVHNVYLLVLYSVHKLCLGQYPQHLHPGASSLAARPDVVAWVSYWS